MSNAKADQTINSIPSAKKLGKRELDKVAGGKVFQKNPGAGTCECVPGTSAVNTAVYNL